MSHKKRAWTFTLFTPTNEEVENIKILAGVRWMIMQNELCPTSARLHIQGAVWFVNAKTFTATKALFPVRVHLEIAQGTARKNRIYCTKEGTRATGARAMSFEIGTMPRQGVDGVFGEMMEDILIHTEVWMWNNYGADFARYRVSLREFRRESSAHRDWPTVITVYWGATGTGKSRRAIREASRGLPNGQDYYDMMPTQEGRPTWADGYIGQKNVLIEDFAGGIGFRLFLRLLDRHRVTMEVKNGRTRWAPKRIWITSNKDPRDWYPTEDYEPLERRLTENGSTIERLI